ncbi:hypothetical protein QYF36_019766 [Acer negundo]|nr:hypothetical protein QYF36_019766 [Acer negundo]
MATKTGKLMLSAIDWLCANICFWDIASALLGLLIFSCIHQKLTNKGPMLWPVLGNLPALILHFNDMYSWVTEVLIEAGRTFHYRGVWMGRAYGVFTADPSNIEYIMKTNFKNFPKGSYLRERFHDLLGDGILNADGETWREERRMAKVQMHSSRFMEYSIKTTQDLVHHKLLILTEKLVKSGESFDLQELLLRFTFDNICTAALGVDPGCLSLDLPEVPFAKAFEEATELSLCRFLMPPFVWKPLKFFGLGYEKRLKKALEIVHDFADKTVEDRRKKLNSFSNLNDQSDLLSRLMETEYTNRHIPDKFFRDFCLSFSLAGRDTTSVALSWFFWLLDKNPEVETRILREINEISSGHQRTKNQNNHAVLFTVEELKKMVYLQAALSESLRLYPSVPIEMKEVLEDDVLPDGNIVRKGARVLYCIFSMARIESIWGKDCLEFKPERWINKDGEFVSENQFKYPVFNAGPRLCIGKKFAYMQMKMVAASILMKYSVKVVEGHDVVPKVTTTLYMKNGLMVTLKPSSIREIHRTDFSPIVASSSSLVRFCVKFKMSKAAVLELPPSGGFSFDLCRRNDMLSKKGHKSPSYFKTGTTIVGLIFQDGVILGADTRATAGPIVCDKNCEKIHYMAPNIYCCGAGTAADTESVTDMVSSQLQLHRYHTSRESRVVTALSLLKSHLFKYQGHVQAALVLGGVDATGPHLHTIYPHGSTDTLPFATMGSGSLAAMAVFESKYREGLTKDEGINLVCEAICSGIFNDLGSGSNVDVCVITKGHKEYLRNHQSPNPRTYVSSKGYPFPKKTEVLLTKITPLKEQVEVIEGGDAMEE